MAVARMPAARFSIRYIGLLPHLILSVSLAKPDLDLHGFLSRSAYDDYMYSPDFDVVNYMLKQKPFQPGDYGPTKDRATQIRINVMLSESGVPDFQRSLPESSNCSSAFVEPSAADMEQPSVRLSGHSEELPSEASAEVLKWLRRHLPNVGPVEGATLELLNAGMGTTATRSLHNEVCAIGIPSLHYAKHCWLSKRTLTLQANILRVYDYIKKCAAKTLRHQSPYCHSTTILEQLVGNVTQMVKSGVRVLSDVPYTNLVPLLRVLVPNLNVVQTLRDPFSWAVRRVEHSGADTVCKHPWSTMAVTHFDMLGCLMGKEWVAETFVPQGELIQGHGNSKKRSLELLGAMYARHMDIIAATTRKPRLRLLCAWDVFPNFDGQMDETAMYLTHGEPPEVQPPSGPRRPSFWGWLR